MTMGVSSAWQEPQLADESPSSTGCVVLGPLKQCLQWARWVLACRHVNLPQWHPSFPETLYMCEYIHIVGSAYGPTTQTVLWWLVPPSCSLNFIVVWYGCLVFHV